MDATQLQKQEDEGWAYTKRGLLRMIKECDTTELVINGKKPLTKEEEEK
jgi:hypothetical protein